jgi:hypothetical protein
MDDDTTDAAQHQQQLDERRHLEDGWKWWPSYHKALCERQKAEREALQATNRALMEWLA